MEDADMGEDMDLSSKMSSSTRGESKTEEIDIMASYCRERIMVFWNLEDYPIPENAELGSIEHLINEALDLMGFSSHTEIESYGCGSPYGLAAYMPTSMIIRAHSTSAMRKGVTFFVIAKQITGSELDRVQKCLDSRGYRIVPVVDRSRKVIFESAESFIGCVHFLAPEQLASRGGRVAFFSGEEPIGSMRCAELLDELNHVLVCGKLGYSDGYASYVSTLCRTIAMAHELDLGAVIDKILQISPMHEDMFLILDKVLCERGIRYDFIPEEDLAVLPVTTCDSHSDSVSKAVTTCDSHSDSVSKAVTTCDSHSDPISKAVTTCDSHSDPISNIEDFSEPITPVKTALFWDVVACPFPPSSPDAIYGRIKKALCGRQFKGEMTIWAYVDENKGPWTGEYLRNKTWDSSIYFLPGGDNASRLRRMLNDTLLWKMDMLYADNAYIANVIVVSDQVRQDKEFVLTLQCMRFDRFNSFLVTPTEPVNKPESLEWPRLLLKEPDSIGSSIYECSDSESSPKRHKTDDG